MHGYIPISNWPCKKRITWKALFLKATVNFFINESPLICHIPLNLPLSISSAKMYTWRIMKFTFAGIYERKGEGEDHLGSAITKNHWSSYQNWIELGCAELRRRNNMVGKSSWKRRARAKSAWTSIESLSEREVARALLLQQDLATNDENREPNRQWLMSGMPWEKLMQSCIFIYRQEEMEGE